MEELIRDDKCAYIRTGRNPVEDVYTEDDCPFEMNKSTRIGDGEDVVIVACGEMVRKAVDALEILKSKGIEAHLLDMYCVKPIDKDAIIRSAKKAKLIVTVEEHSPYDGLGSMVAQIVSAGCPKKVINIALPDAPVITGTSSEVFAYYGMDGKGIAGKIEEELNG